MRSWGILGTLLLFLVLVQGCVAGYNSALFATRSNIGFDADTTPPNLEIAISRYEGVLEPTFEHGQTVPVVASLSTASIGLVNFFWGVKSVFATGEAAFTMSHLYAAPTPPQDEKIAYKKVTLSQKPIPTVFGATVDYVEPGDARPVVFGTDTTLGIKIRWSGTTAQYPSSINIGFKRKEGAFAPIAVGQALVPDPYDPQKKIEGYEADVPSLLATLDTDVTAPGTTATFNYVQYFATGCAANALARQKEVRLAMLKRADPSQDIQAAEKEEKVAEVNRPLIQQINEKFASVDDTKKGQILAEAQRLKLVGPDVQVTNFKNKLALNSRESSPVTENLKTLWDFAKGL